MRWRDLFGRRKPSQASAPATPTRGAEPLTLDLRPAPPPQPLPIDSGDPLDREVGRFWVLFQRKAPGATWSAFLDDLADRNAELEREIAKLQAELAHYPADAEYRR